MTAETLTFESYVAALKAVAEPTRLRALALLRAGELSVGELAGILGQSQPRLSRHMKFLTAAGCVERTPEGAWAFYRLAPGGVGRALANAALETLPVDDPVLTRDRERLAAAKAERRAAADRYFAEVADRWDRLRSRYYDEADVEAAILDAAGPGPFPVMVDLGTGTGRMLELFAPLCKRLEGLDASHQMLTVARANLDRTARGRASVRAGDVRATPFADAEADLVVIHQVLHFLDDPQAALAEASRILKPGGTLILADYDPHDLEALRAEHQHRRLGLPPEDVRIWLERAGFAGAEDRAIAGRAGADGLTVRVWRARKHEHSAQGAAA